MESLTTGAALDIAAGCVATAHKAAGILFLSIAETSQRNGTAAIVMLRNGSKAQWPVVPEATSERFRSTLCGP
jgi:hypothetical protein